MGQLTPFKTRIRTHVSPMSFEEAQARASELFADALRMPVGNARTATLKEACDYRMLAEMKRLMSPPNNSSPAG